MHKYLLSSSLIELFSEYKYFSPGVGVSQLSSSDVTEIRLGNKFSYALTHETSLISKKIYTILHRQYLSKIPINQSATAYVEGKSYFNFIEPHRDNFFFIRLDLKNFFHSIRKEVIINNLSDYFSNNPISDKIPQTHIDAVYNLLTIRIKNDSKNIKFHQTEILPIGFPLSPVITNIIFRKIDILIEKYCSANDILYTRYADDLLFSSKGKISPPSPFKDLTGVEKYKKPFIHSDKFIKEISLILNVDGYKINNRKNIIAVHTLSLNGYTIVGRNHSDVKGFIRISNKKTKKIEKLIHEINNNEPDTHVFKKCFENELPTPRFKAKSHEFIANYCQSQINNKLVGYRSYLISIIKFNTTYDCVDLSSINKYIKLISKLDECIKIRIS